MTRLFVKLAFSGLRRRRLHAVLTIAVVAAAAAALTLALAVGTVADRPWDRTFAATNAPHVTVSTFAGGADLTPVERMPGVVASTGVLPVAMSAFDHDGRTYGLRLVGGATEPPVVGRPLVVAGRWPRDGEVLLERSFARFLGLAPGDVINAAGTRLRVAGVAVSSQAEPYPLSQPGVAVASTATLARVAPDRSQWASLVGVRLRDPDAAAAFAARVPVGMAETWQETRADAVAHARSSQVVLSTFSVLLLLAGGLVLATLVGGRVLAQVRELALLKAAGLTPGEVARVLLIEQLAFGAAGVVLGIAAGTLATPLFVTQTASLLAAPETASFDPLRMLVVAAVVLACVAAFTLLPSWRAGRRPTAHVLAQSAAPTARRSRLGRIADRLALPLAVRVGARGAFAHPARATLTALCLALTVGSCVATLAMEASLDVATQPPPAPAISEHVPTPAWDPVDDDAGEGARLRPIVYSLDAVLLAIGLANLVATILLGVRERTRDLGLLKAVGLTPRQVTASFLTSQAVVAVLAALAGIPLGLAIFRAAIAAAGSADEFAYPAWWWLALLAPAAVAVVLAAAAPLARRAASVRVVDALRFE